MGVTHTTVQHFCPSILFISRWSYVSSRFCEFPRVNDSHFIAYSKFSSYLSIELSVDVFSSWSLYLLYWLRNYVSFSFISGVSGTSLFNSVSLMAYNVFYTSVPVLASVLDKDLSEETIMQHPQILFYCQAGRFDLKLHCHCPVYSLRARLSFHMDCSGSHYIFSVMLYLLLVNVIELCIVLETGFWILAHLLDGLGDPFFTWVLFVIIVSIFLWLLSLSLFNS